MKKSVDSMLSIIKSLVSYSPRQGKGEIAAAKYITGLLDKNQLDYGIHKFTTKIPQYDHVSLVADTEDIPCRGACLESGIITSADRIVSSFFDYDDDIFFPPNINFNPRNGTAISMTMLYKHPSIAIHRNDINKIISASRVHGEVVVKPYQYTSQNILAGNRKNPRVLAITHYDGLEHGAVDNASGVAVLIQILLEHPELLDSSLFVFAGNEELSYNLPLYWGNGYREFQKEYPDLFTSVKQIVAIDSVGYEKPLVNTDLHRIKNAFPFDNVEQLASKIAHICCSFSGMMPFYHSQADTINVINPQFLEEAFLLTHEVIRGVKK